MTAPAGPAEGAYVLPADLRQALGGTAGDMSTAAGLDDATLAEAISEAQTEIDGRISALYPTPLPAVPPIIRTVTLGIAAYIATITARQGDPILPGDPNILRYQRAQGLLGMVAAGTIPLDVEVPAPGVTADTEISSATVVPPSWSTGASVFVPGDLGLVPAPGPDSWRPSMPYQGPASLTG